MKDGDRGPADEAQMILDRLSQADSFGLRTAGALSAFFGVSEGDVLGILDTLEFASAVTREGLPCGRVTWRRLGP